MNVITNLLSAIKGRTGIEPTPFSSKNISSLPCISYTAYRQGDNAVVESWRFQLRFTAETLAKAVELEEQVADLLVSLGDLADFGALRIEINGGGTLEDPETGLPQLLTYYDITTKSQRGV